MKYTIIIFTFILATVAALIGTGVLDIEREQLSRGENQEEHNQEGDIAQLGDATTTAAIENGYALSFALPDNAKLSRERAGYYKVRYTGAENEAPALTDGYTVTMTLLEKGTDTSLTSFVERVRSETANAANAEIERAPVGGRAGLAFTHETELGNTVTEHFIGVDAETVAQITTSVVGSNTAPYAAEIAELLRTLSFPQVDEDDGRVSNGANERITISNPSSGDTITSPLVVEGQARGPWYFEATFPVVLVDWDGLIIAEGNAQADGDWMTEDFVPFTAELNFDSPYAEGDPDYMQNGTLILQKANPSGRPENDDAVEIPLQFTSAATP